jgi:hypothetical protein
MLGARTSLSVWSITKTVRSQLAEQYGADVASEVLARSRSNLHLDSLPTMPYATGGQSNLSPLAFRQDMTLPRT